MASVDWADAELRHRVDVTQVVPRDLDKAYPGLVEVSASGSVEVTSGYYTNARVSAKVTVTDPSALVENAWLRLTHVVEGTGYSRELGTFVVADATPKRTGGGTTFELDLRSTLWAMSQDVSEGVCSIGAGAKLSDVLATQMGWARMPYTTLGMVDYRWSSARVLQAAEDRLSWLYDTLDPTGNRLDVDGHGRVTVTRYTEPAQRSASMLIDCADERSVVVDGSVSWSGNRLTMPSDVIVTYTDGDSKIVGRADAPSTARWSGARRGWTLSEVHELQDMAAPHTTAHAQQLAREYLAQDTAPMSEWDLTTAWLPLQAGDMVDFAPRDADPWGDGTARKCLVKACEADCSSWRLKLTLKEV